ncbi:MAG: AmmeMemoRadiSam system protein B [Nitrospiraceae bacterium]|nr:AmmeMemoRadiSam system protein B [Nitrospiraceae bacterium]
MRRNAAVAGQFYHGSRDRLKEQVEEYIDRDAPAEEVIGIVSPHAGLMYSGHVAGAVFSSVRMPHTFIMLGPNHTGLGSAISVMDSGQWAIPTGVFTINSRLASRIALNCDKVTRDPRAHMFEHSLEVQLPFIASYSTDTQIVPIALLSASLEDCLSLAGAIAQAIRTADYRVVILASSDMSHYLPDTQARAQDKKAIDRILAMDPEGLYGTVRRERISMCGYLPVTVMLAAAKLLGAGSARVIKYATSGEVSGDYDSVVGYAGIIVK